MTLKVEETINIIFDENNQMYPGKFEIDQNLNKSTEINFEKSKSSNNLGAKENLDEDRPE